MKPSQLSSNSFIFRVIFVNNVLLMLFYCVYICVYEFCTQLRLTSVFKQ